MKITGAVIVFKNGTTLHMEDDGEIDMAEVTLTLNTKLQSNSFVRYHNTLFNTNEIVSISYLEAKEED